jgi:hypothetical protein
VDGVRLDDSERAAIASSPLGTLPQEVIAQLTAGLQTVKRRYDPENDFRLN